MIQAVASCQVAFRGTPKATYKTRGTNYRFKFRRFKLLQFKLSQDSERLLLAHQFACLGDNLKKLLAKLILVITSRLFGDPQHIAQRPSSSVFAAT